MEYSKKKLIFKQFFKRILYRKMIVSLLAIYRDRYLAIFNKIAYESIIYRRFY